VVRAALATPPARPRKDAAVYSDVGFILLGEALAKSAGTSLDALIEERVFNRLSLPISYRRLSKAPAATWGEMPTGTTRPREPALGQVGLWEGVPTAPSPAGQVDDDNAWVMDGVAGHSGLFGSSQALAQFGQAVLDELVGAQRLAPQPLWERALARDAFTPKSERALGWDTVSDMGSSAGSVLGNQAPGAVGHLGFTGVSLWLDRARSVVVALCTNCTHNGRANQARIREFRPRFHDAVMRALGF
jgi:CubicO group peptidase (beta-lactamase class C family)